MKKDKAFIINIALRQVVVIIYTLTSIVGRKAAGTEILSLQFILFYGLDIVILGIYAICWQQMIKKFDLSVVLNYTPSTLKEINYKFEYEAKDTNRTINIDPEDEEPLESLDIVEKLSLSGNASFTFGDNLSITYPSFNGYSKVVLE